MPDERPARKPQGRPARPGYPQRKDQPARPPRAPRLEPLPDADPALLANEVRRELRALPEDLAERVARYLVSAGLLVDEDPARAYTFAQAAKALAGRVGAVREAVGVTAYAAADYATALRELKAARRISGGPEHLPVLADCERALGHPERALALAAEPEAKRLDAAGRVELAIVLAGARKDLGQPDAAVLALQLPELDADQVAPHTLRLWYAYADALEAAGRTDDARRWFTAAATVDDDGETDAAERLLALG